MIKIMTIDNQNRDEKLQYNINREATKIFALSSGKIDKHEYLTGEEILPSNQQQVIEQTKFTYSPLGKAFEKKTKKKNKNKQVDALKDLGLKAIKGESNNNNQLINNDIYNKILEKRLNEILKIREEIDYKYLVYNFKGNTPSIKFTLFEGPMHTYYQVKNGKKALQQAEEQQKQFLKKIKRNKIKK